MKGLAPLSIFSLKMKGPESPLFVSTFLDLIEPLCSNMKRLLETPSDAAFNSDVVHFIAALCMASKEVDIGPDRAGLFQSRCVAILSSLLEAKVINHYQCAKYLDFAPLLRRGIDIGNRETCKSLLELVGLVMRFMPDEAATAGNVRGLWDVMIRYSSIVEFMKLFAAYGSDDAASNKSAFDAFSYYSFLLLICRVYDLDWGRHISLFLSQLVGEYDSPSLLKCLFLSLMFQPIPQGDRKELKPPTILSLYNDLFPFGTELTFEPLMDAETSAEEFTLILIHSTLGNLLRNPDKFFQGLPIVGSCELQGIKIIVFLIGRLVRYNPSACDSYIDTLLREFWKFEAISDVHSDLVYVYALPKVSETSKKTVCDFLPIEVIPEFSDLGEAATKAFEYGMFGLGQKMWRETLFPILTYSQSQRS
jgi:hypothetical protein